MIRTLRVRGDFKFDFTPRFNANSKEFRPTARRLAMAAPSPRFTIPFFDCARVFSVWKSGREGFQKDRKSHNYKKIAVLLYHHKNLTLASDYAMLLAVDRNTC